MKATLQKIGEAVEACDFFPAPILLRYKTQQDRKSKTGGVFSIFLIILLTVAFYKSWINVFNKTEITSVYQVVRQMDPSPVEVNSQNFVLSVGFVGLSIIQKTNKYFDIEFTYQSRLNGQVVRRDILDMIPCQQKHFSKFHDELQAVYQRQNLSNFLCLPDNFVGNITGKFTSQKFEFIRINVKKCTIDCISDDQIQNYKDKNGAFMIDYFFVNKLINPTLKNPISIYFEDKNYNTLNEQLAIDTNFYISQYQINTDQSLLPYEDINSTTGIFIDRIQKQQFVRPVQKGSYAKVHFRKSDQKVKISRVYRKVDDLFSYIGGLFGILAAFFGIFLINYNKCCYQLEMSNKVFKSQIQDSKQHIESFREAIHCTNALADPKNMKNQKIDIKFNIWMYFKYNLWKILSIICPNLKWDSMKNLNQKIQQTQNQMNIDVLLQKISLHQRSFQCLFNPNQITLLMLQQKISISELKAQRQIMNYEDQKFMDQAKRISKRSGNRVANDYMAKQLEQKDRNQEQEDEMMLQIYEAIEQMKKQSKQDEVCKRILWGLREDLMKQYEKYLRKTRGKPPPKRTSVFSKFNCNNDNSSTCLQVPAIAVGENGYSHQISNNVSYNSQVNIEVENSSRFYT